MQIFLVPSLILCLVTFDCEYMFFRALLKGLFETVHLNQDCVFGSTNNLGTFKMNYWVLGLRKTTRVVKPSGIPLVHRHLLSVLSPRMRPRFCVLFLCLAVFKESERKKVKSCSRVWLFVTPWTVAYQAPPSIRFSRQEYWSGLPFPSPGNLPDPEIEPRSPALEAEALTSEPPGKPAILRRQAQSYRFWHMARKWILAWMPLTTRYTLFNGLFWPLTSLVLF